MAYRIKKENRTFAVVTDLGNYDDEIVQQLQGLDTLSLEANHDIHILKRGVYPYPLNAGLWETGDICRMSGVASRASELS